MLAWRLKRSGWRGPGCSRCSRGRYDTSTHRRPSRCGRVQCRRGGPGLLVVSRIMSGFPFSRPRPCRPMLRPPDKTRHGTATGVNWPQGGLAALQEWAELPGQARRGENEGEDAAGGDSLSSTARAAGARLSFPAEARRIFCKDTSNACLCWLTDRLTARAARATGPGRALLIYRVGPGDNL
jgi:hypothetical protein